MKKIFLMVGIIFALQDLSACDICGCSSGNYFIGPFPQFRKHFFGLRYSFRSFRSEVAGDQSQFSKDFYQTMEFWGGYNLNKKWQLLAFVPYNLNKQSSDDGVNKTSGLGDISFILNYKLLNTKKGDKHGNRISQQLWVGGGLKLPTGKFSPDPDELVPTANNQPGTGSLDFILNALYSFHINDWGINTNVNYKINSSADQYKYGNRLNASAFIFYSVSAHKKTFNPNVGILYEHLNGNKLAKEKVVDTGGYAALGSAGMEVNFSKMAVGFNLQLPISQKLSNKQTETQLRGMAHVTFMF